MIKSKSSTVKYAFPLFFGIATLLGASALLSETDTYIILEADNEEVIAGQNFAIDVYVVAQVPINAVDIRVALPVSQVKMLGVDTGESVITLWTKQPYFENGTVYFSGGTYRKGFVGKHKIGTINGQALTSGLAHVGVTYADLYAGDGTGDKVTVTSAGEDKTELKIAREDGTFLPSASLEGTAQFGIVGDIDGDGKVSLKDLSAFMNAWQTKSANHDFDGDNKMTFRDFGIILSKFFFQ